MPNELRGLRASVWLGASLLIMSAVMQSVFPRAIGPLPAGMRTPVLALELARSSAELETMFGPAGSSKRAQWIAAVNLGDTLDFPFIVLYTLFFLAVTRTFVVANPWLARACVGVALLAGAADVSENLCLFAITAHLGGNYASALSGLVVVTWIKWLAIALILGLLSASFRAHGHYGRFTSWLAAIPLPIAIAAAAVRGALAELMLLATTLALVAIWICALIVLRRNRVR